MFLTVEVKLSLTKTKYLLFGFIGFVIKGLLFATIGHMVQMYPRCMVNESGVVKSIATPGRSVCHVKTSIILASNFNFNRSKNKNLVKLNFFFFFFF